MQNFISAPMINIYFYSLFILPPPPFFFKQTILLTMIFYEFSLSCLQLSQFCKVCLCPSTCPSLCWVTYAHISFRTNDLLFTWCWWKCFLFYFPIVFYECGREFLLYRQAEPSCLYSCNNYLRSISFLYCQSLDIHIFFKVGCTNTYMDQDTAVFCHKTMCDCIYYLSAYCCVMKTRRRWLTRYSTATV